MALYNLPPGAVQQIVFSAAAEANQATPIDNWLIYNRDLTNTVIIQSDRGNAGTGGPTGPLDVDPGNISLVGALEQKTVSGKFNWWATTPASNTDTVELEITPGGLNAVVSPAEAALQIATLGLATSVNQGTQIGQGSTIAGNTGTANTYLGGTVSGALIANTGLTVGQEVAALIASGSATGTPGGAPLLHGFSILSGAPSNTFLGGGGSAVPTISNITRPGYVFTVYSQNSSGASTIPFVGILFQWKDLASGLIVAEEQWYIANPFSAPANLAYFAKGPTKANSLNISFKNFDPAVNANIFWTFAQTTQHISRDDWRGPPMTNVPGWTATVCDPFALVLAAEGSVGTPLLIPASSAKTFLLPLYAGEVQFSLQQINAPQSLNITITSVDPTIGVNANGPLYLNLATAATSISPIALNLPRTPCQISITNNSATTQAGIAFYMSVLEYAS